MGLLEIDRITLHTQSFIVKISNGHLIWTVWWILKVLNSLFLAWEDLLEHAPIAIRKWIEP